MNFNSLGVSEPILRALNEKGYTTPSPIQIKAIPAVLSERDVMAAAQTGTGKTGAFAIPVLQRLASHQAPTRHHAVRALIVTPTRELAAQVQDSVRLYGKHLKLSSAVVFGGVNINPQIQRLRQGVDILVATPGRLLDLVGQNAVKLNQIEILVLDEADRMLDMGFIHDIKRIVKLLPAKRQSLLFSATFSPEIRGLAKDFIKDPIEIDISPRNSTAETIKQVVYTVAKNQKTDLLSRLVRDRDWSQVLVFSRTKHGADRLAKRLAKDGILVSAIHGDKSQSARTKALADFKNGKITVLVATDIAARGLDIKELPHVVNFDLPHVPEDYVHRIGRTGRAGNKGEACSLVCPDEAKQLRDIQKLIKITIPLMPNAGYSDLVADTKPVPQQHGKPSHSEQPKRNQAPRRPNSRHSNRPGRSRTPR